VVIALFLGLTSFSPLVCFDCFDKDGSGTIDEGEFINLCRMVNNAAPLFVANFKKALEQFDVYVTAYRGLVVLLVPLDG
jgi:hypothetical protein